MSCRPAPRNPIERDARVETHGDRLRVELYRGGKLQAVRQFATLEAAMYLIGQWMVLGPALFTLELVSRSELSRAA